MGDSNRTFGLATNSFLLTGGDGYSAFRAILDDEGRPWLVRVDAASGLKKETERNHSTQQGGGMADAGTCVVFLFDSGVPC